MPGLGVRFCTALARCRYGAQTGEFSQPRQGAAGQNAALKAGYLLIKEGIEAKIVIIPNKLDPDEWVKKEGKKTFLSEGIDKALDVVPFHVKISKFDQKSSFEKSRIIKEILSKIKLIQDPIIRQE